MNELIRKALEIAVHGIIIKEEVEKEVAEWRFSICKKCPEGFNAEDRKCNICGCLLPEKCQSKTNRSIHRPNGEVTHCPLGKWNDLEIANHYRAEDGLDLLT